MGSTSEQVVATMQFQVTFDDGRTAPILAPRVCFPTQEDAEAAAYESSSRSNEANPEWVIDKWLAIAAEFGGVVETERPGTVRPA